MPDFEALIRHQQVVNSPDFEKEDNLKSEINKSGMLNNFFGGFIGSIIGTLTILFLYINKYLPMELLKIN